VTEPTDPATAEDATLDRYHLAVRCTIHADAESACLQHFTVELLAEFEVPQGDQRAVVASLSGYRLDLDVAAFHALDPHVELDSLDADAEDLGGFVFEDGELRPEAFGPLSWQSHPGIGDDEDPGWCECCSGPSQVLVLDRARVHPALRGAGLGKLLLAHACQLLSFATRGTTLMALRAAPTEPRPSAPSDEPASDRAEFHDVDAERAAAVNRLSSYWAELGLDRHPGDRAVLTRAFTHFEACGLLESVEELVGSRLGEMGLRLSAVAAAVSVGS